MLLPRATPSQVTVKGAAPLADMVSEAYVGIRLDGSRISFTKVYQPTLRDASGREVKGVEMTPASVQVEVPIEQLRNYKTVSLKAILTGTVASGYWISGIVVQPSTVTFGGDPQILDTFGYVETSPVDVSGAITEVLRSVSIYVPAGTALDRKPEVFVKVSVEPIPGGQIVRRPVLVRNLTQGLTITLRTQDVDVRLEGSTAALRYVRPTDIVASVNVTGMLTGTYEIPITLTTVPTGTRVVGFSPDRVGVSIR
jgi:YbbR domain-containing protein